MKKIAALIFSLFIAVSIFPAGADYINGKVVVAKKGQLPSGLFAKASTYLPGDSIAVTNPSNGLTIQLLNLGTLDENDGIAILLSQESAEKLGLEKDSAIQVKIARRDGSFDQVVSGNAILSNNIAPSYQEEQKAKQTQQEPQSNPYVPDDEYENDPVADSGYDCIEYKNAI